VQVTSTTPEKKHVKSDDLYSPDVIRLTKFLKPPPQEKIDRQCKNDELDLLDSSSKESDKFDREHKNDELNLLDSSSG
jgi:hypothetical protein